MQTGNQNTDPQRLDSIDAECLDNKKAQQREAKRQEFHALVNTIAESRRNALWLAAREVQRMGSESAGADDPDWDAMPWVAKEFHAARLEADARLAGDAPPTDRPPMAWWEEAPGSHGKPGAQRKPGSHGKPGAQRKPGSHGKPGAQRMPRMGAGLAMPSLLAHGNPNTNPMTSTESPPSSLPSCLGQREVAGGSSST
jgi:hypothetical protein